MIFLGDIASPFAPRAVRSAVPKGPRGLVVANLEGALTPHFQALLQDRKVFNHPDVATYLQALGCRVVSLANNHIMDVAGGLEFSLPLLRQNGIIPCGAGATLADAARPAIVNDNGVERVFLAFGWETIGCRSASARRPGVNPLRPDHVLASVGAARRAHPAATVVALMHWNYELETFPQPMDRQLAFAAIDAGASAIIGCHSHCVQGIEIYHGAPIVYGLGNWYFAQCAYWSGRLSFPRYAQRQLAFEWIPERDLMTCHWFDYSTDGHQLFAVGSEPLHESEQARSLTPFSGMDHHAYVSWFRAHRRKRLALPVYVDYRSHRGNTMRNRYVAARQILIRVLAMIGAKHGPRLSEEKR